MLRRTVVVVGCMVVSAMVLAAWLLAVPATAGKPVATAPPPVPVNAAQSKRQDVPVIVPAVGTVESADTVAVMPQVNGRIMQVYFRQGQAVTAGQPLFLIDPRPYQAALDEQKAQLARDRAVLAEAKADLARYHTLITENSIAAQQAQDQRFVVGQDEGTVKLDQANVASAALNLSYCHVTAPIAGQTGALQVDLGNYVQAASSQAPTTSITPLVTITRMHPIYVSFSVPQTQIDTIRQNQAKGPLTVEAYTQGGKLIAKGQLSLIDNVVNTATGTIMLEATFANRRERLWPDQFVSVKLVESVRPQAITVPSEAVMAGPSGSYVYVIGPANKVSRATVQVAQSQAGIAVISKGLQAGQTVVTNGQYRLTNGVTVSVQSPAAAPVG